MIYDVANYSFRSFATGSASFLDERDAVKDAKKKQPIGFHAKPKRKTRAKKKT